MRRITDIATFIFLFVVLSCSKLPTSIEALHFENSYNNDESYNLNYDNHVSINDIHRIINRDFPTTKNDSSSYDISVYLDEKSDTLMYILNYGNNDGWKIYSSDKRTPAILAEGDKGSFSIEDGNPAIVAWLSCMATNIAKVKSASDEELTFNDNEINSNKTFWQQPQISSRLIDPDQTLIPSEGIGHWEEAIISSRTVEHVVVEHMVPKWDQNQPYNFYSPYYDTSSNQKALTGCVAIAGAQVLYHLHNKLGIPQKMFSKASCVGTINSYFREFWEPTEEMWNSMSMDYRDSLNSCPEAILIAHVGEQVNMHYSAGFLTYPPFSWAVPANLKTDLFEFYGISCSHGSYDEDIVKRNLMNEMPVIISASDLMVPLDGDIHCFVIDGYRTTRTEYTHCHYFVWDVPPTKPYLPYEEYFTTSYSPASISGIKINWGWSSQWNTDNPLNDGWYTLTDRWVLDDGTDYNYYRKMIYDFDVAEVIY